MRNHLGFRVLSCAGLWTHSGSGVEESFRVSCAGLWTQVYRSRVHATEGILGLHQDQEDTHHRVNS